MEFAEELHMQLIPLAHEMMEEGVYYLASLVRLIWWSLSGEAKGTRPRC